MLLKFLSLDESSNIVLQEMKFNSRHGNIDVRPLRGNSLLRAQKSKVQNIYTNDLSLLGGDGPVSADLNKYFAFKRHNPECRYNYKLW